MAEMWQNIPTTVLDAQRKAAEAQAWADSWRKRIAASWAAMHSQHAYDTLGPLLGPQPPEQGAYPGAVPQPSPETDPNAAFRLPTATQEAAEPPILGNPAPDTTRSPLGAPAPESVQFQGGNERYLGPEGAAPLASSFSGGAAPLSPSEVLAGAPAGIPSALGEAGEGLLTGANALGVGLGEAARELPGGGTVVDWLHERGRENPYLKAAPNEGPYPGSLPPESDPFGPDSAGVNLALGIAGGAGPEITKGVGAAAGKLLPRVTEQLPLPMTLPAQQANSLYDKLSVARFAGMLSGTATHLVNAVSNLVGGLGDVALKPAQVTSDVARVGVGRALGKDVERQRYFAEVGPQAKGYAAGFWAGMQQVPRILAGAVPEGALGKYDTRRFASGSPLVDTAVELPLRLLAASDAVFRGAAFGGHSAALAVRQATQEGLSGVERAVRAEEILGNLSQYPAILDGANKLAARAVFQEERGFTKKLSDFRAGTTETRAFFDVFLPFIRTPYNVAAQGAGMTPAGYASAVKAAMKGQTGEAVDRAVRATAGTLGLYGGLQMAAAGYLTGAYPEKEPERSTLPEGWKPYSLRIPKGDGAVYAPVAALGPLAVPLGVAVNLHDAFKNGASEEDLNKSLLGAVKATGKYMSDMSALQGFSTLQKLLTDPERAIEPFSESLAVSAIPFSGLMKQVQQGLDDAQRDPHGPVEAFLAAIPGLSGNVRTKQTALGQERERGPAGPAALAVGSRIGVEKPDTVLSALRKAGVGIPDPPKEVSHENVKDIPLTEDDRRAFRSAQGDAISARIRKYVDHPKWASGTPDQQKEVIEQALDQAREEAKLAILKRLGKDEIKRRLKAKKPAA
jgi:hypothetical protein